MIERDLLFVRFVPSYCQFEYLVHRVRFIKSRLQDIIFFIFFSLNICTYMFIDLTVDLQTNVIETKNTYAKYICKMDISIFS